MNATRKTAIGAAVGTTVLTAGLALGSFGAASGAPAQDSVVPASAASPAPVVTATMTHTSIHLSPAGSLHAGLTIFKVVTRARHGDHTLQLLRLHHGYSMQQASSDINKAFQGNLPAIHRVDNRITWLGGAEATKGHPGRYAVSLKAGKYLAVDQSGNGLARIRVKGKLVRHSGVHPAGPITTKHNQFHSDSSLPHSGWVRFHNNAEEPHFIVFQHVKSSTTKAQVRRYQRSGSNARPPWGLFPSVSAGVVSPGHRIDYRYSLPAGTYLLACFWPSKDSGMPHFNMGMWKLIHLR
jgi:hypothetical protein